MRRCASILVLLAVSVVGSPTTTAEAQQPEAALTGAVQLTAGGLHTCVRTGNGQARCWGTNYDGEAGNGNIDEPTVPVTTVRNVAGNGPLTNIRQIEVGYFHTCAVLSSGQARCWGYNGEGQVGNGSGTEQIGLPRVVQVPGGNPLTNVVQLSLGERHSCARLANGQARCWGENDAGQVGDGTTGANRPRARVVLNGAGTGPLTGVAQIEAGEDFTCARLTNGRVRCWGRNADGQLGDGSQTLSPLPVLVQLPQGPLSNVAQVSAGELHACARLTNGRVRCWGKNQFGQLGDGSTDTRLAPTLVIAVSGPGPLSGITRVDAGDRHTCARTDSGQARCWGSGDRGQLGWDALSGNLRARVVVNVAGTGPLANVRQVRVGDDHSCALLQSGQVRCWGFNNDGQVGDGTTGTDRKRPRVVQLPGA